MTPKIYSSSFQNKLDFLVLGLILIAVVIFIGKVVRPNTTLLSDAAETSYQREIQTSPELGN